MKRNPLILSLALALGLAFVAIPAAMAGDNYRGDTRFEARNTAAARSAQSYYHRGATRCDRRCQRLVRMLQIRGCACPSVPYLIHPVRAHTYLSNHYPPFRYSW